MNWPTIADFALRHPVFCIVLPALVGMQLALIFVAFRTCSCEKCGKPFGIWRCRDQALELCHRCYRKRLPERPKLLAPLLAPVLRASIRARQPARPLVKSAHGR